MNWTNLEVQEAGKVEAFLLSVSTSASVTPTTSVGADTGPRAGVAVAAGAEEEVGAEATTRMVGALFHCLAKHPSREGICLR